MYCDFFLESPKKRKFEWKMIKKEKSEGFLLLPFSLPSRCRKIQSNFPFVLVYKWHRSVWYTKDFIFDLDSDWQIFLKNHSRLFNGVKYCDTLMFTSRFSPNKLHILIVGFQKRVECDHWSLIRAVKLFSSLIKRLC